MTTSFRTLALAATRLALALATSGAALAAPPPTISFSPQALTFGDAMTGRPSPRFEVTIVNTGESPVTIDNYAVEGDFSASTKDCIPTLDVGATCTFQVRFVPTGPSLRTGALILFTTAEGSPQVVTLSGMGTGAVTSGHTHTMARTSLGHPFSWGANVEGQLGDGTNAPRSAPGALPSPALPRSLAATIGDHSLAVASDGTVWAWGNNLTRQLGDGLTTSSNVPVQALHSPGTPLANMVAVSGGTGHSLALRNDGTAWAWGDNSLGQLGDGTRLARTFPVQVVYPGGAPVTNVAAVFAGGWHSLALLENGTVLGWGNNYDGQVGDGTAGSSIQHNFPTQVVVGPGSPLTEVVGLSAGAYFNLALRSDGTVWGWGNNTYGQLGDADFPNSYSPYPRPAKVAGGANFSGAVSVAAGSSHAVASKGDGSVWSWGGNLFGQIGDNSTTHRPTPLQVLAPGSGAVAVAVGSYRSFAQLADGRLQAWGDNSLGQLGDTTLMQRTTPVFSVFGSPLAQLSAASIAFTPAQPLNIPSAPRTVTITNGGSGDLAIAGFSLNGDFSTSSSCPAVLAYLASCAIDIVFTPTAVGARIGALTIATNAPGSPHGVPLSGTGILTVGVPTSRVFPTTAVGTLAPTQAVAITNNTEAGITIASIVASGDFSVTHACGALAAGAACTATIGFTPTAAGLRTGALTVTSNAGGGPHSAALAGMGFTGILSADISASFAAVAAGGVWAWGANTNFELGTDGNPQYAPEPVPVPALGNTVRQLVSGYSRSLALKADGSLWGWGNNYGGKVGDGTAIDRGLPVPVMPAGSGVVSLSTNMFHTLAVKSDGTVWAWGYNSSGEVGIGSAGGSQLTPGQVMIPPGPPDFVATPLADVVSVATGQAHSLALQADGTLWGWGSGYYGQLGDGTTNYYAAPKKVQPAGSGIVSVAAGGNSSFALMADGTLRAWGYNVAGALGDGTFTERHAPVSVLASPGVPLSGVIAISTTAFHVLALKNDGSLWAWGFNQSGQVGDGTNVGDNGTTGMYAGRWLPAQVMGPGSGVVTLAAGRDHSLARKSDGSVWAWGAGSGRALGDGTINDHWLPFRNHFNQSRAVLSRTSITNFQSNGVGVPSTPQTVTLTNPGSLVLNIASITATGAFSQENDCGGGLNMGATCTITITFTPAAVGLSAGSVVIASDAITSPDTVTLGGSTGPFLAFNVSSHSFPNAQLVGTSSAPVTIIIYNTGNTPMTISQIAAGTELEQTNTCSGPVPANYYCEAYVRFRPTAGGERSGQLTVTSDAPGSPHSVSFTGMAIAPQVSLAALGLAFAPRDLGTTSAPQAVRMTNTGDASLTIASIVASGDFARTTNCGSGLSISGFCDIQVSFTPTAAGTRAGSVTITSNAPGSPHVITLEGTGNAPLVRKPRDANGDGRSDIFWGDPDGQAALWLMDGGTPIGSALLLGPATGWTMENVTGDFNGDGISDILWKHESGMWAVWLMNGTAPFSYAVILGPSTGWSVTHVADFDGNGRSDLLWTNIDGSVAMWLMDGLAVANSTILFGPGTPWSVTHVADLDNDTRSDLVWRNASDASVTAWLMNGLAVADSGFVFGPGTTWQVVHTGDFDGNGTRDLLFRDAGGQLSIFLMNGLAVAGSGIVYSGGAFDITHVADFNGDGRADFLFKDGGGQVAVWLIDGLAVTGSAIVFGGGGGWTVTHTGDYNGDGRADLLWKDSGGQVAIWMLDGTAVVGSALIYGGNGGWVANP